MVPTDQVADLRQLPAVNSFLESHGLGALPPGRVVTFPGRNEIWAGRTTAGRRVFVKLVGGEHRFRRSLAFLRVNPPVAAPRCLAWDEASRFLAFDWVAGRSGHDLAEDEKFPRELAKRMGTLVGRLHAGGHPGLALADQSAPELPPVGWLRGLPPEVYDGASAGVLRLWGILQADDDLAGALIGLRDEERAAPRVTGHCDLRLGQFLVTSRRVYLTDWEEFRAIDPARDVGAFAGEWLYLAIAGAVNREAGHEGAGHEGAAGHEEIVAACVAEIERRSLVVRAFWQGYRAVVGSGADVRLTKRAAGFAGWHVIDRVMAMAERRARIEAADRAALGIARMVLLRPASAAGLVGLDGR